MQKEFKRSPGKSAVLVALLPVAAYFIGGPILKKSWSERPQAVANASPTTFLVSNTTAATALPSNAEAIWPRVLDAVRSDPMMAPATGSTKRNPFMQLTVVDKATSVDEDDQARAAELAKVTPEEFGLRLMGTIVSSRMKLATINGRPYSLNETIEVPFAQGDEAKQKFILVEVGEKHVVLNGKGELFRMTLEPTPF